MKKWSIITFILVGALILCFACAGSKQVASDRPGWVDKGPGFFTGDFGKAFYGVGAASNMTNVSLRRTTADTQARVDIARTFKSEIADLVKIYQKEVINGGGDASSAEQLAQQATAAFTEMDLSGCTIIDRFYDTVEKTQYSLAYLNLESFKNNIEKMKKLSKEVQDTIIKNSEKDFDELEKSNKEQN